MIIQNKVQAPPPHLFGFYMLFSTCIDDTNTYEVTSFLSIYFSAIILVLLLAVSSVLAPSLSSLPHWLSTFGPLFPADILFVCPLPSVVHALAIVILNLCPPSIVLTPCSCMFLKPCHYSPAGGLPAHKEAVLIITQVKG